MGPDVPRGLAHHIRYLAGVWQAEARTDADLLAAFAETGDEGAFAALVVRHGRSVWAACRRLLDNDADAEDAFQAAFIALARKARQVRPEALTGWLQKVATDAARDTRKAALRRSAAHRRLCEHAAAHAADPPPDDELGATVREELAGLPERLRVPLALYYLDGKTQAEVGRLLGITDRAIAGRLRRGLDELRSRLATRGVVVTAGVLVAALGQVPAAAAMPSGLIAAATRAALRASSGGPALTTAERLARDAVATAGRTRLKLYGWVVLAAVGLAGGVVCLQPGRAARPEPTTPLAAAPIPAPAAAHADRFGDPLPEGAVARIGTLRFRTGQLGTGATVAFGPGGKVLVSAHRRDTVHVWDTNTGRELRRLDGPQACASVCTTADGNYLVAAGPREIRAWDLSGDAPRLLWRVLTTNARLHFAAAVSPDGRVVACGSDGSREILLLDAATGSTTRTLPGCGYRFAFSADGARLASWTFARSEGVTVWDVATGKSRLTLAAGDETPPVTSAAFSPDGKTVATTGQDRRLRLWDTGNGSERRLADDADPDAFVGFTPDGKAVVEAGGGRVRFWNPVTGRLARPEIRAEGVAQPTTYRLSADGTRLAAAWPSGVRVLDPATGRELGAAVGMPDGPISAVAFSRDGATVAAGGNLAGAAAHLWDARDGRFLRRLELKARAFQMIRGFDFGADGTVDAALDQLSMPTRPLARVVRWDVRTGAARPGPGLPADTLHAAFAPGGRHLAAAVSGGISTHDRTTGREVRSLATRDVADGLYYSADGGTVAAVSAAGVTVWSPDGGPVRTWPPADAVGGKRLTVCPPMALSPDGRHFVAGSAGPAGEAWVVEAATGAVVSTLGWRPHGGCFPEVAFSPDGRTVATAGADGEVRVWEAASGAERHRFAGHRGGAFAVAFSPDGSRLVSAGDDCTALVWDVSAPPRRPGIK